MILKFRLLYDIISEEFNLTGRGHGEGLGASYIHRAFYVCWTALSCIGKVTVGTGKDLIEHGWNVRKKKTLNLSKKKPVKYVWLFKNKYTIQRIVYKVPKNMRKIHLMQLSHSLFGLIVQFTVIMHWIYEISITCHLVRGVFHHSLYSVIETASLKGKRFGSTATE